MKQGEFKSRPRVILNCGEATITLTVPELRPETVDMIVADARVLVQRLEAMTAKCRALYPETIHAS